MDAQKPSRNRRNRHRNGNKGAPGAHNSTATDEKIMVNSNANIPTPALPPQMPPSSLLTEQVPVDTLRFSEINARGTVVDPVLINTITGDLGFDHMMPVQAATILELLPPKRQDCLVQAKTGTGKTIAFLLPAIQTMLSKKPAQKGSNKVVLGSISLLVIAPTRELAMQIAKEATNLLQRMKERTICIAVGGTNKDREERQILAGCDILVATPGRLLDHISHTPAIKQAFSRLDTIVLDEADRLLDMGFLPDLQRILSCLPDKLTTQRQGMLFSATVPPHVAQVADLVLSPGYKSISTISSGEAPTHARVPQLLIEVPTFSEMATALIGAIRREISRLSVSGSPGFKAIVFAQTAAQAEFYGFILAKLADMPPSWTLHARHTQSKRTNVTSAFRSTANGILVATDVVARGMDFPAVTTVFQVGVPMDRESYIHRLGRTARGTTNSTGGSTACNTEQGRGVLIVAIEEMFFPKRVLREIRFVDERVDLSSKLELERVIDTMDEAQAAKTYQAWLGYYKSHMKPLHWDKVQLVATANTFARDGLRAASTPPIQKSTVGKMGLRGTPGLVVVPDAPRSHHGGQGNNRDDRTGKGSGSGGGGGGGGSGRAKGNRPQSSFGKKASH